MLLSEALENVEAMHSASSTPGWYRNVVGQFIRARGDVEVADVTPGDLKEWVDDLKARGLSRWTLNSYVRATRAFWNHVVKMGALDASPFDLKIPTTPPATPKDISDDDVDKLVRMAKRNPRDLAIILVLRDAGCRAGGLVSMRANDVEFRRDEAGDIAGAKLLVVEKGDKARHVFVKREAAEALDVYMGTRPVNGPGALWLNRNDKPLTVRGLYSILKVTGRRAGVERFNPHAFRHRLCKKLVANGAPTKIIQDLLGWTSPAMIQIYAAHGSNELEHYHSLYT